MKEIWLYPEIRFLPAPAPGQQIKILQGDDTQGKTRDALSCEDKLTDTNERI